LNIIFDFGGVVFQWRPAELLARVLPGHTATPAATQTLVQRFFQGYEGAWGAFDKGLVSAVEAAHGIASQTGLSSAQAHDVIHAVPGELQPMPLTVELIRRLRQRGHRLFFLSNMPAPYADHLLRTHDFLQWFEDGVFSSGVRLGKPDAAIFRLALERFGIKAEGTLFIDDHPANLDAARRQGLTAIPFTDAARLEQDLIASGAL
jgi:HAD superfamily hydrolase (TIGR01509 family)